jgi:hypothetical protein
LTRAATEPPGQEANTMKRFKDINDLHSYIERQAKRIIKHYYTGYKHYDRPAIMKATGNKEKECYLILRDCGSYFYTADYIVDMRSDWAATVMDYYQDDSSAQYFRIDFDRLTVEKIPAGLPDHLKAERDRLARLELKAA